MQKMVSGAVEKKDLARGELFDWVANQPQLNSILKRHHCTRETLNGLYSILVSSGAGQWAGGNFVAAAAFTRVETLSHILAVINSPLPEGWSDHDRCLQLSFDLVEHFRIRRPLSSELQSA